MRINRLVRCVYLSNKSRMNHRARPRPYKSLKVFVESICGSCAERLAKFILESPFLRRMRFGDHGKMQFGRVDSLKSNLDLTFGGNCLFLLAVIHHESADEFCRYLWRGVWRRFE